MTETRRQKIMRLLEKYSLDFDELRAELLLKSKELEEELVHLEKTVKAKKGRVHIDPATCMACGHELEVREKRRFNRPKRCPVCKEERVSPPCFRIILPE